MLEPVREYGVLLPPPTLARFLARLCFHGESTLAAKLCLGLLSTLIGRYGQ